MEMFEYRCLYCDYLSEEVGDAFDDWPACPICGGETVRIFFWVNDDTSGETERVQMQAVPRRIMGDVP